MLRYPTTSHTLLAPHRYGTANILLSVSSGLSLIHLFLFNSTVPEFMSSSQSGGRFNPVDTLHNRGPGAWMRGLPYLALLNEYFKLYLPVDNNNRPSTSDSSSNNSGGATPLASQNRTATDTLHSTGAASTRNQVEQTALEAQHAQLFVHLAVAYWVDCALVLRREHGQLGLWRRLLTNVTSGLAGLCFFITLVFQLCSYCCTIYSSLINRHECCRRNAPGRAAAPFACRSAAGGLSLSPLDRRVHAGISASSFFAIHVSVFSFFSLLI